MFFLKLPCVIYKKVRKLSLPMTTWLFWRSPIHVKIKLIFYGQIQDNSKKFNLNESSIFGIQWHETHKIELPTNYNSDLKNLSKLFDTSACFRKKQVKKGKMGLKVQRA